MAAVLTGGCLCGAVRYRIAAAPLEAVYCHCEMCRRAHGAPAVAWPTVPIAALEITTGEPRAYRSSQRARRHFCCDCGTPLTWREAENPRHVDVSIGSLHAPEAVPPTLHLWTASRIPWFDTGDRLPGYPTGDRPRPIDRQQRDMNAPGMRRSGQALK